ncbi:MAG: polymer-forming cytoskeletal protein [Acidobacteriales bacterium]|nr:polymer-forming cytoskeletal protein [Terriglobales bacterium]
MDAPKLTEVAHIGKSVVVKGELSGSEDLYVDGQVEGKIELAGNSLTIGPNGQVRADVNAKSVVVQGRLEGAIRASDRADLRKSGIVVGDIFTQRIAVEEGAYFKGKVDIQKEGEKTAAKPVARPEVNRDAASKPAAAATPATGSPATATPAANPGTASAASASATGGSSTNASIAAKAPVTPVTQDKKF